MNNLKSILIAAITLLFGITIGTNVDETQPAYGQQNTTVQHQPTNVPRIRNDIIQNDDVPAPERDSVTWICQGVFVVKLPVIYDPDVPRPTSENDFVKWLTPLTAYQKFPKGVEPTPTQVKWSFPYGEAIGIKFDDVRIIDFKYQIAERKLPTSN